MKKEYKKPTTAILKIETVQMLAVSGQGTDTEGNHEFGVRSVNERRGEWGNVWEE